MEIVAMEIIRVGVIEMVMDGDGDGEKTGGDGEMKVGWR